MAGTSRRHARHSLHHCSARHTFTEWHVVATCRFVYSVVRDGATGQEVGLYQAVARAGAPGAIPGLSASPPRHYHNSQTECFTVK